MRRDWDGQYYTGVIPEVNHTYNVVGNINEHGLIITETTFGGRGDLSGAGTGAIVSYGDLIWTTLQRARTAREAIRVMDALCTAYGYESSGESFGVADGDEVWLLELIGKGKYGKGAVWVASRVPDGYIGATSNQARTTTFNQSDPDNVIFSSDVISFARSIGAFSGADADFNFREAYDPISFSGARFGEARRGRRVGKQTSAVGGGERSRAHLSRRRTCSQNLAPFFSFPRLLRVQAKLVCTTCSTLRAATACSAIWTLRRVTTSPTRCRSLSPSLPSCRWTTSCSSCARILRGLGSRTAALCAPTLAPGRATLRTASARSSGRMRQTATHT